MARLEDIESELKEIKEILFGRKEEGEEDGLCKKVKDMHNEFVFFKRIYKVLMVFLTAILLSLVGILLDLIFKHLTFK